MGECTLLHFMPNDAVYSATSIGKEMGECTLLHFIHDDEVYSASSIGKKKDDCFELHFMHNDGLIIFQMNKTVKESNFPHMIKRWQKNKRMTPSLLFCPGEVGRIMVGFSGRIFLTVSSCNGWLGRVCIELKQES